MQAIQDQWSPLFASLKDKLSDAERMKLLGSIIQKIRTITEANLGDSGVDRPEQWPNLSQKYAIEVGRGFPTLILSGAERRRLNKDEASPHLDDMFVTEVTPSSASLTNLAPYASEHQKGEGGQKRRPFFPVVNEQTGQLTQYAEQQIQFTVEQHFED